MLFQIEKKECLPGVLLLILSVPMMTAEAGLISAGSDTSYRFYTGSNITDQYQLNIDFGTPLPSGDGFIIDFGTTLGGNSLGSTTWNNPFNFPILGVGTASSYFPTLSSTGYTYLTFRYSGNDVDLSNSTIGLHNTSQYTLLDGVELSPPSAYQTQSAPDSTNLGASVITSFRNYVEGSKNTEKTYLERINECAAQGADCDFDSTANDQEFRQNLQNAADATYASKDLVTRTSLLPENKLELAADAQTLLDEIKAFFQWIGILPEDNNRDEVINASVEGEAGQFTVNPTFDSYALTYVVDFASESFLTDLAGESFLFNTQFGGADYYAGYGLIESVESFGDGSQRAIFSISQLESNNAFPASTVPSPPTFLLFLAGIICILFTNRKSIPLYLG